MYIKETCCQDSEHIDNFQDEDYQDIFRETADMVKACLEAASRGQQSSNRWPPLAVTRTATWQSFSVQVVFQSGALGARST